MTTQVANEHRAEMAYRALLGFSNEEESREDAAVVLIADLLHMLDLQYGLEPEDALRSAWHHFAAEREDKD